MKLMIVFFGLLAYAACNEADDHCYKRIETQECKGTDSEDDLSCNAKYGFAKPNAEGKDSTVLHDLQKYAHSHITHSFNYLLRAAHFGNYQKSREGFEKLFHKLADSTWDDAIDLIKYLGKRGAKMNFEVAKEDLSQQIIEVHELSSLAYALDAQKKFATEAFKIHKLAATAGHDQGNHVNDPEVTSFLENHFVHKQADSIRDLSGHVNDLKRLIKDEATNSLSLFLFDEYLKKA